MTVIERRGANKPSRGLYALGCLPPILGVVVMVIVLVIGLSRMTESLTQIVVPGQATLTLGEGVHTVYVEPRSVVDGRSYVASDVEGLSVSVIDAQGNAVPVRAPAMDSTYSLNGREGYGIAAFTVGRAGAHTIAAAYGEAGGSPTVIAVGEGTGGAIAVAVLLGLGALLVGIMGAGAVIFWVWSRRRRGASDAI